MLLEVLRETVIDSLKLLPFLFAAYLAIEFIEDRAEEKTVALVHRAGRWGPVLGAALGVIPQCGFSAATANLYAGGIITRGTLLAVFLSTSDEMLPILLSSSAPGFAHFEAPWLQGARRHRSRRDGRYRGAQSSATSGESPSTRCASRSTATARTAYSNPRYAIRSRSSRFSSS